MFRFIHWVSEQDARNHLWSTGLPVYFQLLAWSHCWLCVLILATLPLPSFFFLFLRNGKATGLNKISLIHCSSSVCCPLSVTGASLKNGTFYPGGRWRFSWDSKRQPVLFCWRIIQLMKQWVWILWKPTVSSDHITVSVCRDICWVNAAGNGICWE